MKKVLVLMVAFTMLIGATSCGESAVSDNVSAEQNSVTDNNSSESGVSFLQRTSDFNNSIYFTTFENFVSTVAVKGVDELIGIRNDGDYSYTDEQLEERRKSAEKNLPMYTYYPIYDNSEAELVKDNTVRYNFKDVNVKAECGLSVRTVGDDPDSNNHSVIYYKVLFSDFQVDVSDIDVTVKTANLNCDDPQKEIGWKTLTEYRTVEDDRRELILEEHGWESLIQYCETKEINHLLINAVTQDGEYPCIIHFDNFSLEFNFLIEDNVLLTLSVFNIPDSYKDVIRKELILDLDWLKKLSFKRIDFEYDKYTEVQDYDENLDFINHRYRDD